MKWLVIADAHANLPALEAVLATPEARACDRMISLGDQVNYGPRPVETLERLTGLGAVMLRGNHEDRFSRIDEPEFAAYNWALLRWTWAQVRDKLPELPMETRVGSVLCTHATPGDLYKLVYPKSVPDVLDALPQGVTHLLTGHNHIRWQVRHGGRLAVNPGSLGMLEDSRGGIAPFAVLDMNGASPVITCHAVPYDVDEVIRAYVDTGCWRVMPEMTHLAAVTMRYGGAQYTLLMVAKVKELATALGRPFGDREVWARADRLMDWPDGMTSEAYWKRMEREA